MFCLILFSKYAIGIDGIPYHYQFEEAKVLEQKLSKDFENATHWPSRLAIPYAAKASDSLWDQVYEEKFIKGITLTLNGFYGPQGRSLRLGAKVPNLNEYLNRFEYKGNKITNFEMETSALYGLCALLGHEAGTVCAIIANRFSKSYSKDYKKTVDQLIELTLHRLTQ